MATFQETPSKAGKVWVKAGTYDAGRRRKYVIKKNCFSSATTRYIQETEVMS